MIEQFRKGDDFMFGDLTVGRSLINIIDLF